MLSMKAVLLALLSLVVVGSVYAQSPKQPLPHSNPAQEAPKPNERGTEQSPLVIKVLPPLNEDEKAAAAEKERKDKSESDWSLVILTGVLAIIGVIQIIVFGLQARRLRQTVTATKDAADAALKTAKNAETTERAYVKLSHVPPGLGFNTMGGTCFAQFRVRNFGRTPAKVTDVVVDFYHLPSIEHLPIDPPAPPSHRPVITFLVPQDEFFFSHQKTFTPGITSRLRSGEEMLIACGYVDYVDQFGQRHRAGYAREYSHLRDIRGDYLTDADFDSRSNLDLVLRDKYNYDRPRTNGEGND
jgi:hypothetical protein